jgi:hypothetical protein
VKLSVLDIGSVDMHGVGGPGAGALVRSTALLLFSITATSLTFRSCVFKTYDHALTMWLIPDPKAPANAEISTKCISAKLK